MKNRSKTNIFLLIAFVLAIILSLADLSQAQRTKIVGNTYIEAASIDSPLFSATLKSILAFKGSNGRVTAADTAYALGVATLSNSNQISATFKDSLYKFLIDTADYARYLAKGAITDTTQFSDGLKNIIQNSFINKANDANTADYADSTGKAGYATVAGAALTAPTQQHCSTATYATSSGTATYATTAGSLGSADSSVTYNSLSPAVRDSINYGADSAYYAKNIMRGKVDSLVKFSTTVQDSYLVTKNIRNGLRGMQAALTGTNPALDSSYWAKYAVQKVTTPDNSPLFPKLGFSASRSSLGTYSLVYDSVHAQLLLRAGTSTLIPFSDSAAVWTAFLSAGTTNFWDYNAAGSATHNIYILGAAPATGFGSVGDIAFDTTTASGDTTLGWVKGATAKWYPFLSGTGAGGSGIATILGRTAGNITVDSVLYRDLNNQGVSADSILFPHNITADTIRAFSDEAGAIGLFNRQYHDIWGKIVHLDTLQADETSPTADTIWVRAKALSSINGAVGDLGSPDNPWSNTYSRINYLGTVYPIDYITFVGDAIATDNSGTIGTSTYNFGDGYINRIHADDSVVVGNLAGTNIVLKGSNGQITTNGGITVTGAISATGNVSAGTNLITPENYFIGTGSLPRYGMSQNQWYAMDDACSPNDSNEVMTRSAVTRGYKNAMDYGINADSVKRALPYYWRGFWAFMARNVPECQSRDSLGLTNDADFANIGSTELSPAYIDNPTIVPVPEDTTFDHNTYSLPRFVGIVEADTATRRTGKMLIRDWDNPLARGEYIVCDNGSDSIGMFTGYFKTIQAALNNIPNVSVQVSTSPAIVNGYGRYTVKSAFDAYIRYGSTVIDTIVAAGGKRDSVLANYFYKQGSYFCIDSINSGTPYTAANARSKVWTSIDRDSIGATNTRYIFFPDTQAYNASVYSIVVARPWTITVWPNAARATRVISTPITIPQYGPVTIQGVGEKQTVLTNTADGFEAIAQPGNTTIFKHCYTATLGRLDSMAGLPITIKDMTIITRAGSSTAQAPLMLGGRITIENVSIRGAGASAAKCLINYKGLNVVLFNNQVNSLVCQNVTAAIDTDQYVFKVESPLALESRYSAYATAGDSSRVLYASYDMGNTAPRFYQDQFYQNPAYNLPTYLFHATTSQTFSSGKLAIMYCEFIGQDYGSNINFGSSSTELGGAGSYNTTGNGRTYVPAKLKDSYSIFQIKPNISPK